MPSRQHCVRKRLPAGVAWSISRSGSSCIRDRKDPRNKIGNDQKVPLLNLTGYDAWEVVLQQRIVTHCYAKRPFGGPQAVLAYLSRYTHRVAISNRRLIAADEHGVTFRWKDYRIEGPDRQKLMPLATDEFIRRFLIHVLPKGFHRIRHYGLFASATRADNIARARELLAVAPPKMSRPRPRPTTDPPSCPCCGGRMIVIETFERGATPPQRPTAPRPHQDRHIMTRIEFRKLSSCPLLIDRPRRGAARYHSRSSHPLDSLDVQRPPRAFTERQHRAARSITPNSSATTPAALKSP